MLGVMYMYVRSIHFVSFCDCSIGFCDCSDSVVFIVFYTPAPQRGYTVLPLSICPSKIFFVAFFSATIDDTNLIFGHKLHIGTPYRGKRFWTHQIPTSYLPTLLIFIQIEHICSFFSANIDGRNLIFRHKLHIGTPFCGKCFLTRQIPTSCLPT